ncbi:MAG: tetratricopeptide repeat protein [Fuerstiella sp.]|nr:tetratricopeptide repeat protein [Fuerstiella sp.]
MSQGNSVPRVSVGVPWWLWLFVGFSTLLVIFVIFSGQDKESAEQVFSRGLMAADDRDGDAIKECVVAIQRTKGADEGQITLLKGIEACATNRFPRSVKIMEPFLNDPNLRYQKVALRYSAIAHQTLGNSDRARQLYEQYQSIDPTNVNPRLFLMNLYNSVGALQSALKTAESVLELDPDNRKAMQMIAEIKMSTGDFEAAKDLYNTLLETEQDRLTASPDMIKNYVHLLLKTNGAEVAFNFAEENYQLLSDEGTQLELLMGNKMLTEAANLLQKMEAHPHNPLFAQLEGIRALDAGSWDKAVAMLAQAVIGMPRSSQVFEQLKEAADKNNQTDLSQACIDNLEAIHELENQLQEKILAIGDDMKDPELRLSVADAAVALGRLEEAGFWIDRAANVAQSQGLQVALARRKQDLKLTNQLLVPIDAAFRKTTSVKSESSSETTEDSDTEEPSSDDVDAGATSSDNTETPETAAQDEPSGNQPAAP